MAKLCVKRIRKTFSFAIILQKHVLNTTEEATFQLSESLPLLAQKEFVDMGVFGVPYVSFIWCCDYELCHTGAQRNLHLISFMPGHKYPINIY